MSQKIIGLGFGPGGCIMLGDKVYRGNVGGVEVAQIVDNSVEFPDSLHRIYVTYTKENYMISSYENCSIEVMYEVPQEGRP